MMTRIVTRILENEHVAAASGGMLTFPQLTVLKFVAAGTPNGPCRVGDLARHLQVSFPGASQAVRRLARGGWVRTVRDRTDTRQMFLQLTPKARAAIRRHESSKDRLVGRVLADTDQATMQGWNDALEGLIGRLLLRGPSANFLCLGCGIYPGPDCVAERHGARCPVQHAASES